MTQTGFTRTKPEFRARIGWLQTKNSMVLKEAKKEINKAIIENPPSPFGYDNYMVDVGIAEQAIKAESEGNQDRTKSFFSN